MTLATQYYGYVVHILPILIPDRSASDVVHRNRINVWARDHRARPGPIAAPPVEVDATRVPARCGCSCWRVDFDDCARLKGPKCCGAVLPDGRRQEEERIRAVPLVPYKEAEGGGVGCSELFEVPLCELDCILPGPCQGTSS